MVQFYLLPSPPPRATPGTSPALRSRGWGIVWSHLVPGGGGRGKSKITFCCSCEWGGDRGAGDREKRGREVYGSREKRGREAGFPRWREAGEKGENYATLRNVSQSKKCKGAGAKKYRAGTGIKGYGKREVQTPPVPPHL